MSDRDVTFRLKLVDDSTNKSAAEKTKRTVDEVQSKVDELEKKSKKSTLAMAEGFQMVATSSMQMARGVAFMVASSEKDLKKLIETLAKVQGAIDIGTGAINFIKGISKAYDAWTASAKATAAANDLVAASNVKVAATGQAAAVAGGGVAGRVGGRIGQIAGIAGVGLGAYGGFKFAESRGYGEFGKFAATVGGATLGGLGTSAITGLAQRYGSGALAFGKSRLAGIGARIGATTPAAALGATTAVAGGLALGEFGSRQINRALTGENRGTLSIGWEAWQMRRENQRRSAAIQNALDVRNSQAYQSQLAQFQNQRFSTFMDQQNAQMQFRMASANIGVTDPRQRSQNSLGILQERAGDLRGQISNANNDREALQLKLKESQVLGQMIDQRQNLFRLAQDDVRIQREKLRLAQEDLSTEAERFGRLSRGEQFRLDRAAKRFDAGDRSRSTLDLAERLPGYKEQVNKYFENKGYADAERLNLENALFGKQRQQINALEKQLQSGESVVTREGEALKNSMKNYLDQFEKMMRDSREEVEKHIINMQNELQNDRANRS